MPNPLMENLWAEEQLQLIVLIVLGALLITIIVLTFKFLNSAISFLFSLRITKVITQLFTPYKTLASLITILAVAELLVALGKPQLFKQIEIVVSLFLTITTTWLLTRISKQYFESYLLDFAVTTGRKLNSELLLVGKLLVNLLIIVTAIILFGQTHHLNVFSLIASLGIGGLAIAFAAQKTLEQFFAGLVLFLDRPFVVDDYIGLPDGSFGRVESIGIRSTRIRTSGKGTLIIVPNDSLTKSTIENFTGAKKVISIISLVFYRHLPDQEKALIRQVILDCTKDIFGIDARNTKVDFIYPAAAKDNNLTHAKVSFFILGSGEVSMELRQQLLDIAQQNINKKLKEYGIDFDLKEQMINIDSPITI